MGLDVDLGTRLIASMDGVSARLDRHEHNRRQIQLAAAQEYRQIPFVLTPTITGGTGSLNPAPGTGPDLGFWWSIRRLSATGFSAGTVILFIDSTAGEPIATFTGAAIGTYVNTYGKGHQMMHPGSNLAITATGITGTVTIYGAADQVEDRLLPWYSGAVRGRLW